MSWQQFSADWPGPGCRPLTGWGKRAGEQGAAAGRAEVPPDTKACSQDGPPGTSLSWDFVSLRCGTDIRKKKLRDQSSLNWWYEMKQGLADYTSQYSTGSCPQRPSFAQLRGACCFGNRNIPILGTQTPSNSKMSWHTATWPWEPSLQCLFSARQVLHSDVFWDDSSSAGHTLLHTLSPPGSNPFITIMPSLLCSPWCVITLQMCLWRCK